MLRKEGILRRVPVSCWVLADLYETLRQDQVRGEPLPCNVAKASSKLPVISVKRPNVHKTSAASQRPPAPTLIGNGFIKTSAESCGKTDCAQEQCCTPEAVCTEFQCAKGFLKTSFDACGTAECTQKQCCDQRPSVPTLIVGKMD